MQIATDDTREFLARVLPWPQDGDEPAYGNIHYTIQNAGDPKAYWRGKPCRSVAEAVDAIQYAMAKGQARDVYYCTSTQRSATNKTSQKTGKSFLIAERNQQNAVALKALFIDIDYKDYATTKDLTAALAKFLTDSGMPKPTMLVHSGGGLHVYWVVSRALSPAEWTPLAFALAEATKQHGLKCDQQCTIDSARVLRVPGTLNRKSDPPRPVTLLGSRLDFDYLPERLEAALEPYKTITPQQALLPYKPPLQGDSPLASGIEVTRSGPMALAPVAAECEFVRHSLLTGGRDNDNPLWNLTTLIAAFTDNPIVNAHLMARSHPGYSKESTDELFQRKDRERQEKNLGWPKCATISGTGSKFCQSCQHFGKGKSPLNLALQAAPPAQQVTPQGTQGGAPVAGAAQSGVAAPAQGQVSDLPDGYVRGSDGVVSKVVTNEDGGTDYVPICEYRMVEPWLQTAPRILHFTTTAEGKKDQPVVLPFEIIGTADMRRTLQDQGVFPLPGNKGIDNLTRFFMTWIKRLQDTREAVKSSPFGWNMKGNQTEGFVYGNRIWTPNGDAPAAAADGVLTIHYTPVGDPEPWKKAAELITSQGRPELEAIVASAFAAPLVKFSGQPGVLMSAYSPESGIGKSTALKVAQAVWGDPIKAIQSLSDTQNSTMHKLGQIRSLPLYWDELKTEEDTKKFTNITFQTTQGKDKSRLNARVQQREPGEWQTLLVSASNDSLLDYVVQRTSTTTAGLYRIFEYVVHPPQDNTGQIDTSEAALIVSELHHNYGAVGLQYAKFLGANHSQIKADVAAYMKELGQQVQTKNDERFWIVLISCIMVGARYAKQLGFVDFNEESLKAFMLDRLEYMRSQIGDKAVDMSQPINLSTILTQFLAVARTRHTLFTNRIHSGRGKPASGSIKVVRETSRLDGVHVHVGMDDKMIRISSTALGDWLREKGYSRHLFTEALKKEFGFQRVSGRLGGGTDFAGGTEPLLQVDLIGTPLINFIDEA